MSLDFSRPFETTASGLYRMTAGDDAYLFTQFEPTDARRAFPCWDEPSFKIPYRVILQVPEGLTALTNTPIDSRTAADGWETIDFAETPPLPSYLLALAVGPFDRLPMDGLSVPGAIYAPRGQGSMGAIAAEITPPLLEALEQWFERPYPFAKLDFVAVPEFWPGAMENPGLVTYADNLLLLDPERASNSLTLVRVPEWATYQEIYLGLKERGYIVYESKDQLAGKTFQVANMGALEEVHVDSFLAALGQVLEQAHAEREPAKAAGGSLRLVKNP